MTGPGNPGRWLALTLIVLGALTDPVMAMADPVPSPPAVSDESAVVQELLVIGRHPGPALWRVAKGDSDVVIVGGLSPIPHLLQWNTIRVEHALEDSTVLFLPPDKAHVGLFDAAAMFLRQGALKPAQGADMETTLPPALRARFERVRDSFHGDPKRYQHWKPAVAGLILVGDFSPRGGAVGRQARHHHRQNGQGGERGGAHGRRRQRQAAVRCSGEDVGRAEPGLPLRRP